MTTTAGDAGTDGFERDAPTNADADDLPLPAPEDTSVLPPDPDDASDLPLPTDAGPTATPDTAPTTSLAECFGAMGTSNPSTLKDLLYDSGACPNGAGGCMVNFRFNVGCSMELQDNSSGVRMATADAQDCQTLRLWSTSERLLSALRTDSPQAAECKKTFDPSRYESTIVGGTPAAMKTFFCDAEPFVTHRKCLARVREKYFPAK